ncbi:DEAD-box ATP-dependent RNA helicase 20 [Artemisia annua]|uniref:DEAD-box ATP-dependent RNA helicase 20 n=1 Tax=Artemisia annua TaxID=35608 RepID=A0A2U1MNY4_ARTAN|nr:DEAD-box ATP-dependent RNA helicase 20 [Artemisia annua]
MTELFVDVKNMKYVISYDFPCSLEAYVHRIGRIGRAKAKWTTYSFFTAANSRFAEELIAIFQEAVQKVNPDLAATGRGINGHLKCRLMVNALSVINKGIGHNTAQVRTQVALLKHKLDH